MRFKDQMKTSKAAGRGKKYTLKQSVRAESKLILKHQANFLECMNKHSNNFLE